MREPVQLHQLTGEIQPVLLSLWGEAGCAAERIDCLVPLTEVSVRDAEERARVSRSVRRGCLRWRGRLDWAAIRLLGSAPVIPSEKIRQTEVEVGP